MNNISKLIDRVIDLPYSLQVVTSLAGIAATSLVLHLDQTIKLLPMVA
jgi:hypothetical protein